MADQIQVRRDTAANWTLANPILAQGEPGYETDTDKIKYGDGTTVWASLSYFGGAGNDPTAIHSDGSNEILAITEKTALIATDLLLIEDSENLNIKKRVQISNLPSGAHGHPISEVTDLQTNLDGKASSSHGHPISEVTDLQTNLDAKASSSHGHPISEVTDLQTNLDAKASTSHDNTQHSTNYATDTHVHSNSIHKDQAGEISGITEKDTPVGTDMLLIEDSENSDNKKKLFISNLPGGADPNAIHSNGSEEILAITEKTTVVLTDLLLIEDSENGNIKKKVQISNLPSGAHGHPISEVTDLQTNLDGKASSSHGHPISEVTDLQTNLDAKASSSHATSHNSGGGDELNHDNLVGFEDGEHLVINDAGTSATELWSAEKINTGLLSTANKTDLTDTGESTLHYHATDRNRANHSGNRALATPASNLSADGIIRSFTSGEALLFGKAVFVSTDGKVYYCDVELETKFPCIGITVAAVSADSLVDVLLLGTLRDDSFGLGSVIGKPLYPADGVGTLSATAPSTVGEQIQRVAIALSATEIYVNPSLDVMEK